MARRLFANTVADTLTQFANKVEFSKHLKSATTGDKKFFLSGSNLIMVSKNEIVLI